MTLSERSDEIGIFLVTPPAVDRARFPGLLAETLAAAPVAAVLLASGGSLDERQSLAEPLVPLIQQAGAAALVLDDTRIAGRIGADGVHMTTGQSHLETAIRSLRPKRIVGAGSISSRHTAMEAGEADADYLFFGKPHGDAFPEPHPRAVELAEWWADLMEIPGVLMLGSALEHLQEAVATRTAFVGAHRIIWDDPAGAPDAMRRLHEGLRPKAAP